MIKNHITLFINDTRGNIVIFLGLFLIVLVIGIGLAVDVGRVQTLRARMQAQVDSTALAVGLSYNKNPNQTQAQLQTLANQYFVAGFPPNYFQSGALTINLSQDNSGQITVKADTDMPTYIMKAISRNSMHVSTSSTILHNVALPTEVVLALDVTGSMSNSLVPGDPSKYAGLQVAATDFLSIFKAANTSNNIYIGIVPYTQTVNIGVSGVASVPIGGTPVAPVWNTGNSWLDASDPSLNTANYDWGDAMGVGYTEGIGANNTYANVAGTPSSIPSGWNRIGTTAPYGWGGCVMARNPAVNGVASGLPLDISDDKPSDAPFQRFYYPSDGYTNTTYGCTALTTHGWNIVTNDPDYQTADPCNPPPAKITSYPTDLGCGFNKCDNVPTFTQGVSHPAQPAITTTTCAAGEGNSCTTTTTPAVPAFTSADVTVDVCYNSIWGYNPWRCHSSVEQGSATPTGYTHIINDASDNQGIYDNGGKLLSINLVNTSGPNYTCPMLRQSGVSQSNTPFSIFPLESANDAGLQAVVNNINPVNMDQNTAYSNATTINIGLAWSWRLISSRWAGLWNDAVDAKSLNWRQTPPASLKQFVVIMTDGQNNTTNSDPSHANAFDIYSYTAYGLGSPYGVNPTSPPVYLDPNSLPAGLPDSTYLDNKTLALCTAMGKAGITIFAVGFGTVGTGTGTDVNQTLLQNCVLASGGNLSQYSLASDNATLDAAFQKIANEILTSLRVTN